MDKQEKLITPKEFAETLSMHEVTVRKWIREGRIKSYKINNYRRIPESELQRLIEEGK